MGPGKPNLLLKPTLDTRFHIDYGWWDEQSTEDLRPYLLSQLPSEQRDRFLQDHTDRVVDYIHPETGEVFVLNELGLAIQEAAKEPDFITPQVSTVDSVFRVFLANGNIPLTPIELAEQTGRDAQVILRTFSSMRIYRGIRPYQP